VTHIIEELNHLDFDLNHPFYPKGRVLGSLSEDDSEDKDILEFDILVDEELPLCYMIITQVNLMTEYLAHILKKGVKLKTPKLYH